MIKPPEEFVESQIMYQVERFHSRFEREENELGAYWNPCGGWESFGEAKIAVHQARQIDSGVAYRIVQIETRRVVCG